MPTTKSAAKRLRQSQKQRLINRSVKSDVKTQVKKVRLAVAGGDIAAAETEFRTAASKLDRAGVKRYIHPNAAARTKSRLQHLIKSAKDSGGAIALDSHKPKKKSGGATKAKTTKAKKS